MAVFYRLDPALAILGALAVAASNTAGAATDGASQWIDRARGGVTTFVTRSAQRLDGLSGSVYPESRYQRVAGSISTSMEWTEFDGWSQRFRFRIEVPLPGLDERFNAFIGRIDRDDVVSGQPRNRGLRPISRGGDFADQTLAGISFIQPGDARGSWDASAGVRVRFPLDPYLRGGWRYQFGDTDLARGTFREIGFWQASEGLGTTTRFDLERVWNSRWYSVWSTSATVSQKSEGIRAFTAVKTIHKLTGRRSLALEFNVDGESDAEVPLSQYGVKGGYRFAALREWLVFELSAGVNWPRERLEQSRQPSWGVGVGVEMLLGEQTFSPFPVTF